MMPKALREREPSFWIFSSAIIVIGFGALVLFWLIRDSNSEPGTHTIAGVSFGEARQIPAPEMRVLAQFDAPAFLPPGNESPALRAARQLYSAHNFIGATAALQPIATNDLTRFYLGISELLSGKTKEGQEDLRRVTNAPYQEAARYYIAKALLANQDAPGARLQLKEVIAMHGDFEPQAHLLLARLH